MSEIVCAVHVSEIKLPGSNSNGHKLHTIGLAVVHEHYLVFSSHLDEDNEYKECIPVNSDDTAIVKVIDISSNVLKSEIDVKAKVIDVIKIEEDQIAVAARSAEGSLKVELLTVSELGSLEKSRQIELHNELIFSGFTYRMGTLFIAAFTKVLLTDMEGNELKTFNSKKQGINVNGITLYVHSILEGLEDGALFKFANEIAVSPDNQTIYVTDIANFCVSSFSIDGEHKTFSKIHFTDEDDEEPGLAGIEVDNEGTVFVNDKFRKKIYVLSEDSNIFETLIDDKEGPFTIAKTDSKLYVAMEDTVHIYSVRKGVPSKFQRLKESCLLL